MSDDSYNPATRAITRRMAMLTLAFGSTALLAACAGATPAPTSAPANPAPAPTTAAPLTAAPTAAPLTESGERTAPPSSAAAAKPSAEPSPAPKPTQAPPKPLPGKVTIMQPAVALSFAPFFVARAKNLFQDEGVDAEIQLVQTDAPAIAALTSGDAQFVGTGSSYQFQSHEKDLGFLTVAGFATSIKMEIAVRKDFLQQKGVTPQHPLKDKASALKGARFSVSSLAGTVFQYAKYALKTIGVDPENDVEIVAVPSGPPVVAAIRGGQIDAFIMSPPDPEVVESEGAGSVFIQLGEELPVFKSIMYMGLFGKKSWIEQNSTATERVCRAIGRANNIILNDLPTAKEAIKSAFPNIAPPILDLSVERLKTAFGPDARMTEEMWKNAADVYLSAGMIKAVPPLAEGTLWTNKYLVNVPKR